MDGNKYVIVVTASRAQHEPRIATDRLERFLEKRFHMRREIWAEYAPHSYQYMGTTVTEETEADYRERMYVERVEGLVHEQMGEEFDNFTIVKIEETLAVLYAEPQDLFSNNDVAYVVTMAKRGDES